MTETTHSDEDLKQETLDQLYWDSRIGSADINAEVSEGRVTLTGSVPSYTAKRVAETSTWDLPGVRSVVNNLETLYPAGAKRPTDTEVQGSIVSSLIWNANIDATQIRVSVEGGIVTLGGLVHSYWHKRSAGALASDTMGVSNTINNIRVMPSERIIDESISRAIITSLDRHPQLDADAIHVKAEGGIVTLSGVVPYRFAYETTFLLAARTVGVVDVINDLIIE